MKLYAILNEDRFVTAVLMRDSEPEGGLWLEAVEGWAVGGYVAEGGAYTAPSQTGRADPDANFIPVPLLRQRIEALGMWDAFAAYLAQNPAEMLKVLTVETGVDPAYPALAVAFDAMDVPQAARDVILAPPSAGVGVP